VIVVLAALIGYLGARLLWLLLAPAFSHPSFQRLNYREKVVPTGAGVVLALVPVFAEAVRLLAGAAGLGERGLTGARAAVVVAAVGFGLVGLLDDVVGTADRRGMRGHIGALVEDGRLTTGGLKLLAGAAVALIAVAPLPHDAFWPYLADAALVALAANLGNLLDRAPGRTIKVGTAAFVGLAAATVVPRDLVPVAVVAGAGMGLLLDDLHERLMLGDAGANVIGAALGVGAVATTALPVRLVLLAIVAAANLASEWVSFGKVIDSSRPLRGVDRWGRV
jgi:UDP-N-acetylmuramyl pentapeptide phosphotransferase/UDP-N-acetylglucosamine-1-phosphate transferase